MASRPRMSLVGETFGRLTVIKAAKAPYDRDHVPYWKCRCQCGKTTYKWGHNLIAGRSKSCGCYRRHVLKTRKMIRRTTENRPAFVPGGMIHFREARMPVNSGGSVSLRSILMPLESVMLM